MKVVYLNPSAQLGGAERSLLDILASIRAAEPDWSLQLVVSGDGPLVRRAAALGVTTTIVPFPPALGRLGDAAAGGPAGNGTSRLALLWRLASAVPMVAAYVRRLRCMLRASAPDVVHTNGFKMHVLGALSCPRRMPVIWHVHDYVGQRPVMARLLRWKAARCAAVVANSCSVARDMRAVCGHRVPIYPVHNSVDLERFSPSGPTLDLDALAGLAPAEPGTVRVGLVATLARWKGHEIFLRALALLPPTLPIRAYIIGGALYDTDGSQYSLEELRRLARHSGVAHQVGFTGYVDEPAAAMRALDIVVHASTQPEPFGLVIVEAMACGKAIVVSAAGGAVEITDAAGDASTHPPGDAAALADCMRRLVAAAELRVTLGHEARALAQRRFDRAPLARELVPLYREVTSSAS